MLFVLHGVDLTWYKLVIYTNIKIRRRQRGEVGRARRGIEGTIKESFLAKKQIALETDTKLRNYKIETRFQRTWTKNSCWPTRQEVCGRLHLLSFRPSPSPPFLSRTAALSTLFHHSNFFRCLDSPWATKGATLRKRSSCHPLLLELAPSIVPLLYFSGAPSRPWWVAVVANSNIG